MSIEKLFDDHPIPITYVEFPNPNEPKRVSAKKNAFYANHIVNDLYVENKIGNILTPNT